MPAPALSLFGVDVPDGFRYRDDFITPGDESALLDEIATVEFSNFEMRGVIARRRVAFFGLSYDESRPAVGAIPKFLLPLRARIAAWADRDPDAFAMALINEYRPGSPIGWHRDAPQYDIVAGVSLGSSSRMKFRPYVASSTHASTDRMPRRTSHELTLAPRSAYLITGAARQRFEHSIPPVEARRYSITFRTLRRQAGRHTETQGGT